MSILILFEQTIRGESMNNFQRMRQQSTDFEPVVSGSVLEFILDS